MEYDLSNLKSSCSEHRQKEKPVGKNTFPKAEP